MNFLLSAIVGMLAVELFLRMPVIAQSKVLLKIVAKSSAVVTSSRISDHWKERVVKAYAGQIALLTLKIASMFLVLGVILYTSVYMLDLTLAEDLALFLIAPVGIAVTTCASVVYYFVRTKFMATRYGKSAPHS